MDEDGNTSRFLFFLQPHYFEFLDDEEWMLVVLARVFALLLWVHVQSLVVEAANLAEPGCCSATANSSSAVRQFQFSTIQMSYLAARKLLVEML